jgi:hypothetical protein
MSSSRSLHYYFVGKDASPSAELHRWDPKVACSDRPQHSLSWLWVDKQHSRDCRYPRDCVCSQSQAQPLSKERNYFLEKFFVLSCICIYQGIISTLLNTLAKARLSCGPISYNCMRGRFECGVASAVYVSRTDSCLMETEQTQKHINKIC